MKGTLMRAADSLAREHTERAVETIVEVMSDPFAENRDRLRAAEALLDRGHGKPLAATIAIPANRQQAAALAALTDEELMERITGVALPRMIEHAPVDAAEDPLLR
jgi:HEAT repeat protein